MSVNMTWCLRRNPCLGPKTLVIATGKNPIGANRDQGAAVGTDR